MDDSFQPDVPIADVPSKDAPPETPASDQDSVDLAAIRDLVLAAHPDIVPDMVKGDSVAALLASVEPAREAYQRVSERFQAAATSTPASVPAGGSPAPVIDPARLPTAEKIRRGLQTLQSSMSRSHQES